MTKANNTGGNSPSNSGGNGAATSAAQQAKQPGTTQSTAPTAGNKTSAAATAALADNREQTATTLVDQVKSTATNAYQSAATKATETIDEKKTYLTGGLTNIAENVRQFGQNLTSAGEPDGISKFAADYTGTAAQKLEQAARYFDKNDLNAIYRDVESAARRNPAMVLGAAFVLGFVATRFLKSTPPHAFSTDVNRQTESNQKLTGTQAQGA